MDHQASMDAIYDATLRKNVAEALGNTDEETLAAVLAACEKRVLSVAREREHFRGTTSSAIRAGKRSTTAMGFATSYTWTTASGENVRVEPIAGVWGVHVNGIFQGGKERPDAAVDLAARLAPPADTDLAKLLTWTACGRSRV